VTPTELQRQLTYFTEVLRFASSRKAILEELMQRPIAKSWDAVKKAKMVRRLMTAKQTVDQAVVLIEQIRGALQQSVP